MTDQDQWKYVSETRTLPVTLPRMAWLSLEAILAQPGDSETLSDLVAGLLQLPVEGFLCPSSWQRNWLQSYFGAERIAAAERAFETACREFAESCKSAAHTAGLHQPRART